MLEKFQKFIRKLQNSEEAVKKRWLFGATALVMLLVTALWSVYISHTVKNLTNAETEEANNLSFSAVFNTGLQILGEETIEEIKILIDKTKSLTTFKKEFDFTLDTLEEIQPKQLP